MLVAMSALRGYAIEASDGAIAKVDDVLFDDVSWKVRWIVVEAGTGLTERRLLLHPSAIRSIGHEQEVLVTSLTKAQFEASPPVFEHEAMSQHLESRLSTYYGSDRLWRNGNFGVDVLAPPLSMGSRFAPEDACPIDRCSVVDGDPHLRSLSELDKYAIDATDGSIGHVESVLVDDEPWAIRFLIVDTRNWWPGKHVLVPVSTVREIDYAMRKIKLTLDRDQIGSIPAWDPIAMVDKVLDKRLPDREGWHAVGF